VHSGTATLKDATSEAIRDWVTNVETTHYILGSAAGPHPYPMMVNTLLLDHLALLLVLDISETAPDCESAVIIIRFLMCAPNAQLLCIFCGTASINYSEACAALSKGRFVSLLSCARPLSL
jgi:hypothetical protein